MFSRKFLVFFGLVLIAAVVVASIEVEESDALPEKISEIIKIIGEKLKWAAKKCLKEAALNCKQHWREIDVLVQCAKDYLIANKGRCVIG